MLDLETIAVEPELAQKGVWAEYAGGRFLLARPGDAYQDRLMQLYKDHAELIKSETPESHLKSAEIFKIAFAETVILDWDNICDKNKQAIPYTKELGIKLMTDPRHYELQTFLESFVNMRQNYQRQTEAEIAKDVKNTAVS